MFGSNAPSHAFSNPTQGFRELGIKANQPNGNFIERRKVFGL